MPTHFHRRDLLKGSAAAFAVIGLSPAMAALQKGSDLAHGNLFNDKSDTHTDARFISRQRPACLDLRWAPGTGLIWMEGETVFYENPRNRYMRFRRTFTVDSPLRSAEIRMFADTRYTLWINGRQVGRGPGRSDNTWAYFDTHDVRPYLQTGENTIAVLVLFQGFGTGDRRSIMQALLSHLTLESTDGRKEAIVSDRSWRASPSELFLRPTPRLHATLGCVEVQDMRFADERWILPGYDDSGWQKSDYVKVDLGNTPWYHFVPEPLPPRSWQPLPRTSTISYGKIQFSQPRPIELGALRPAVLNTPSSLPLQLDGCAAENAQVATIDFGRVEYGALSLNVVGSAGTVIDVLCGELLVDNRLPRPEAARIHTTRYILRAGQQTLTVAFNLIAFRYAQLWIWTQDRFELKEATLSQPSFPLGTGGHFRCSDDFLNRLDATCEHTLRLCTQDGIVDSASREMQQWIGDGRYTAVTLHQRFAAGVLHRRLIEQIGQGIDWMGSLIPRFPTGNLNVSPIPLYSLQWVLAFRDHAWFTDDRTLATEWWPSIQHVLRWFTAFERVDGMLERVPHWMYIEVGENKKGRVPSVGAINTTLNLHYMAALEYAAEVATEINDQPAERYFGQKAKRMASSIRSLMWDEDVGAYRDSLDSAGKLGTLSEGTNAHALVFLDKPGSSRATRIIDQVFRAKTGDPIRASPFAMNAVFSALGKHRRADLVFPMLPERYTEQVQSGAMWEHWSSHQVETDGTPVAHSLSHAWGAGALSFFVEYLVGISPAAAGWSSVRIAPQPGALMNAEASVVTCKGLIRCEWHRTGEAFEIQIVLPEKVEGICTLPDGSEVPIPPGGKRLSCAYKPH